MEIARLNKELLLLNQAIKNDGGVHQDNSPNVPKFIIQLGLHYLKMNVNGYCGRFFGVQSQSLDHDGMCGPIQGPTCGDCQQIKAVNFDKVFFQSFQKILLTFL